MSSAVLPGAVVAFLRMPRVRFAVAVVMLVLADATIRSFANGAGEFLALLFTVAVLLVTAIWLLTSIAFLILAIAKTRWRLAADRTATLTLGCVLTVFAMLGGDYVHLALTYPAIRSAIRANSRNEPVRIGWGATGFLGPPVFRALVYDESGTMANEIGTKTDETTSPRTRTVGHLVGGFYIETDAY